LRIVFRDFIFGLLLVLLLASCAVATPEPEPTETPAPTPRPTLALVNACDIMHVRDVSTLMGEPMTVFDESKAGEATGEFSFISRCDFAGSDPVSEARLVLTILQPKPGLEVLPIEEIAERYVQGMQQAGLSQYEPLAEFGEAAFWLPETQSMTVFQEDGTGITVSVEPLLDNAREVAHQMVENAFDAMGY
jgi:hypothetical protein